MRPRTLAFLLALAIGAPALRGVEAGIYGGAFGRPAVFCYGLSAGSAALIPLLKFEFEGFRLQGGDENHLTAAVKIRPRFGKIAPYGLLGAGTRFQRLTFRFGNDYEFFTLYGGGLHLFPVAIFSLRFDVRVYNFSPKSSLRLSAGLFLHL